MDPIISVAIRAAQTTGWQVSSLLGPIVVAALLMHFVSRFLQNRAVNLIGYKPYVYLTAPGTVVHELGHAFFCILFAHKILQVQWFKPGDDGVLGFVKHSYNPHNPWAIIGNFFIGTGPIWFGVAALSGLAAWSVGLSHSHLAAFIPDPTFFENIRGTDWHIIARMLDHGVLQALQHLDFRDWKLYVFVYLLLSVGSHITLSPPDIKSSLSGIALILLLWLLLNAVAMATNFSTQHIIDRIVPYGHLAALALAVIMLATLVAAMLLTLIPALIPGK